MTYMLVRHKVADFSKWKRVFDSHAAAQQQAGLRVQKVLQNVDDPNVVVLLFEVADLQKAPGFVSSPAVSGARRQSGVVDTPDPEGSGLLSLLIAHRDGYVDAAASAAWAWASLPPSPEAPLSRAQSRDASGQHRCLSDSAGPATSAWA